MTAFTRFSTAALSAVVLAGSASALRAADVVPQGYNTPIPEDVLRPDRVKTRIGSFIYFDGFPNDDTMAKARRQVDLGRGVQTFLNFMPAASLELR